ncbi:MAG: hypothetical protein JSW28_07660 [Thermoplasmata archaeon]|nr:MAG: hypothetical protein JSW28_07660 [Thermoplasmata archaeon]
MARITEWEKRRADLKLYLVFGIFIVLLLLMQYLLQSRLSFIVGIVLFIGVCGMGIGVALYFVEKRISGLMIFIGVFLIMITLGLMQGFFYMFLILLTLFTAFIVTLDIWASTVEQSFKVFLQVKTSIAFFEYLIERMDAEMRAYRFNIKREGNMFYVYVPEKEKVIIVTDMNDETNIGNYYEVTISTKSKDFRVESLKKVLRDLVLRLDRERSIESYPWNKKYYCRYCKRVIGFVYKTGQFYCSKCSDYRKRHEVEFR